MSPARVFQPPAVFRRCLLSAPHLVLLSDHQPTSQSEPLWSEAASVVPPPKPTPTAEVQLEGAIELLAKLHHAVEMGAEGGGSAASAIDGTGSTGSTGSTGGTGSTGSTGSAADSGGDGVGGADGDGRADDAGVLTTCVQAELCGLLPTTDAARLVEFIVSFNTGASASGADDAGREQDTELLIDAPADKTDRGRLHGLVRANWGRLVDTKTEVATNDGGGDGGSDGGAGGGGGGGGGGRIKVWRQGGGGGGGKGKGGGRRWSPGSPEYLRFVMAKEGITTLDAVGLLAKALRCKRERYRLGSTE